MKFIPHICWLPLFFASILLQVQDGAMPPPSEIQSLYNMHTVLSKPMSLPGIYEFSHFEMLNWRQIVYADSVSKDLIAKEDWVKRLPEKDWALEKGMFQEAKQFFLHLCLLVKNHNSPDLSCENASESQRVVEQRKKYLNILMTFMLHSEHDSDLHVLQGRQGCEVMILPSGDATFLRGVEEYSHDGENFISFNVSTMEWETSVDQAKVIKEQLNNLTDLNKHIKDYLKHECVERVKHLTLFQDKNLRNKSAPDVFVFAKRSPTPTTVVLICWATGFYLRDVSVNIRRNGSVIPETNLTKSPRIRPNGDGTFQLRKNVEIPESEKADYDCWVNHRTLKESKISKWDGKCLDCDNSHHLNVSQISLVILVFFLLVIISPLLKPHISRKWSDKRHNGEKPKSFGSFEARQQMMTTEV